VAHCEFAKYLLIIEASNSWPESFSSLGTGKEFCFLYWNSKFDLTYCNSEATSFAFSFIKATLASTSSLLI
jgi:hypothetical protein